MWNRRLLSATVRSGQTLAMSSPLLTTSPGRLTKTRRRSKARPGMPSTLARIIGGIVVIGVLQSSALDWWAELCSRWRYCLACNRFQCGCHSVDCRVVRTVQAVAARKKCRIVVGQPSGARRVLPDHSLEWKIDAERLSRLHQRCAGLCIAEDQEFCWPQRQPDGSRARGVINMGKDRHSPGPDLGLEPVHRFLRSIATFDRNQSICGHCLVSRTICECLELTL